MSMTERQSRQLKAMSNHVPEMLACSPPPDSAPMEKKINDIFLRNGMAKLNF
jgi:hypothetical protein